MNLRERLERLQTVLGELREKNLRVPVIVEGRRDAEGLRALGLEGTIIRLNMGRGVFRTCEEVSRGFSEAIILTDWDRRGGQLCRLLRQGLEANQTAFDTEFRARLAHLSKKETRDVEGLPGFIERLRRDPRVRGTAPYDDTYK
jgi:dTMP kinase